MTILILSIVQIFLLEYSLFKDLHIAFAQSTNTTSIFVPSNMSKMEITLKNNQNSDSYSFLDSPFFVAIVSAASAIGGGYMGSLMTNRTNRQMEEARNVKEKEKQDHIEANIRALILHNLRYTSEILKELKDKDAYVSKVSVHNAKVILESIHKAYAEMSFETKSSCFKPNVLTALQVYYDNFATFSAALYAAFTRYEELHRTNELDALDGLKKDISDMDIDHLNDVAKEAIRLLEKNI